MAKLVLSNFKLPPTVKTHLAVASKAIGKDMTALLIMLIEKAYADVVRCFPEKVKLIEMELEQKQNAAVR